MYLEHQEIEARVGRRFDITVSRSAYVLLLSDDDYARYMQLEPLIQTFCLVVQPPSRAVIAASRGDYRAHLLIWPVSEREPEWLEDFTYTIDVSES